MRRQIATAVLAFIGFCQAVLLFMAANDPDVARENIQNWLKWIGIDLTFELAIIPLGLGVCAIFFIAAVVVWFWPEKPSANPVEKNDNRKGNFARDNYGTQTYNEAPQQRRSPDFDGTSANGNITVQVRVYGTDHEMNSFGDDLQQKLSKSGFNAVMFGESIANRYFTGIAVAHAPNEISRETAESIQKTLESAGHQVIIEDCIGSKGQNFIRIGVGGNA